MSAAYKFFSMAIPYVSIGSVMVALFFFIWKKGSVDALKESAAAYKTLAEGRQATNEELESKIERLEAEVENLKQTIRDLKSDAERDRKANARAIDEIIKGFERAGYGEKA